MNVHVRVLTIGGLAKAAGVSAPTIRYYEQIGLIPAPARTDGGQRSYGPDALSRLTFIKQCREFGFGIEQVKVLLQLSISNRDCLETRDIAQAHLDEVRRKLVELRALERRLQGFVTSCNTVCAGGPGHDCVIFKDLATPPSLAGRTCC